MIPTGNMLLFVFLLMQLTVLPCSCYLLRIHTMFSVVMALPFFWPVFQLGQHGDTGDSCANRVEPRGRWAQRFDQNQAFKSQLDVSHLSGSGEFPFCYASLLFSSLYLVSYYMLLHPWNVCVICMNLSYWKSEHLQKILM